MAFSQKEHTPGGEGHKNNLQEPSNVITTSVILAINKATFVKLILFNLVGEVKLPRTIFQYPAIKKKESIF